MSDGNGLTRIQAFLLNTLRPSTIQKYTKALQSLSNELKVQQWSWNAMSEEEQDMFLAEWVLDGFESGASKNDFSWALSAIQKIHPRLRIKVAWKVLDAWSTLVPVKQAPAAPPELLQAMVVLSLVLGRPQLSLVMLLAYAGLLRIREALTLRCGDLVLQGQSVILCLGRTKGGLEHKVILTNSSVVHWVSNFLARFPPTRPQHGMFSISYSSALRWVQKLAALLGASDLHLTTHTPSEDLELQSCPDKECRLVTFYCMAVGKVNVLLRRTSVRVK